jgi:hypothetical protein
MSDADGAAPLVNVLVAAYVPFHTSAASAPNAVSVLEPDPHTAVATADADTLLSAEIEAEVASGPVAVVIAPVIVDVASVTLVAVARPDVVSSPVFAREPAVRVASVKLRVP